MSRCRVVPPQLLSGHCQRSRGRRWSWTLTAGWIVSPQSCPSTVALWTLSEVKRKEVELDSHSWMDCLAAELSHNSCFSDTVLVTLLRTAVETAVSEVHELLHTGGVPSSLTLLFWRGPQLLNTVVLSGVTVPSVFTGRSARTSYSSLPDPSSPPPLLSPSLISLMVSVHVKRHGRKKKKKL